MIQNDAQLAQTREALHSVESALMALRARVFDTNPALFVAMAEDYWTNIRRMRGEIDTFIGGDTNKPDAVPVEFRVPVVCGKCTSRIHAYDTRSHEEICPGCGELQGRISVSLEWMENVDTALRNSLYILERLRGRRIFDTLPNSDNYALGAVSDIGRVLSSEVIDEIRTRARSE